MLGAISQKMQKQRRDCIPLLRKIVSNVIFKVVKLKKKTIFCYFFQIFATDDNRNSTIFLIESSENLTTGRTIRGGR